MSIYASFIIKLSFILLFTSCDNTEKVSKRAVNAVKNITVESVKQNDTGKTISERFVPPTGFKREQNNTDSYEYYLQNLPLKPSGTSVHYFDGRTKNVSGVYAAVVDMDIGKKDLQQCADAVMRLRAEYLYHQKKYDQIKFNFTNGFPVAYKEWRSGKRIKISGNKTWWEKTTTANVSYDSFLKYMEKVFMYAGTLSLSKELKAKSVQDLRIGDVFIQGGSPGHAVLVVDKAVNEAGKVVFMLAQSYMPAQDIQILQNPINGKLSPWYDLDFGEILDTPEWRFTKNDLKSF